MADPARYRVVTFTSLEKRANGHKTGRYAKTFTLSHFEPGELEKHIEGLRAEQKRKNDLFRGRQRVLNETSETQETPPPHTQEPHHESAESAPEPNLPRPQTPAVPRASSRIELRLDVDTGNSTALIGSSKQGKSTCMMELYRQNYANSDYISVLFASSPQLRLYQDPQLVVCPVYEPRVVKLAQAINRKTKNAYEFCFLLDDIVDRRDDMTLKQLILTLRNSNLSSIVCLQYTNLLAKVARANVNNLLLFGFNSDEAVELTCKQFLATHLRERKVPATEWVRYYREATRDHGFIYVHPDSGSVSYHRLAL